MARVCEVCGKGKMMGNNVSHANNRTKKSSFPNVQTVRVVTKAGQKDADLHKVSSFRHGKRRANLPYTL